MLTTHLSSGKRLGLPLFSDEDTISILHHTSTATPSFNIIITASLKTWRILRWGSLSKMKYSNSSSISFPQSFSFKIQSQASLDFENIFCCCQIILFQEKHCYGLDVCFLDWQCWPKLSWWSPRSWSAPCWLFPVIFSPLLRLADTGSWQTWSGVRDHGAKSGQSLSVSCRQDCDNLSNNIALLSGIWCEGSSVSRSLSLIVHQRRARIIFSIQQVERWSHLVNSAPPTLGSAKVIK